MLNKEELIRYNRQIILPDFGVEGQEKLKKASVLVIGAGGLGAPNLMYLAAAGIGRIGIIDFDEVSLSNLHRQVLFKTSEIGQSKAEVAKGRLSELNPTIDFVTFNSPITSSNALDIINDYDVVVDGSDNLPTRYLVNDACFFLGKPLVYGAIFRFEGQVSVFNLIDEKGLKGPNYRDLFPTPPPPELVPSCTEGGVIGVLPGIIGSMQANEVIKVVTGIGETLTGRLFLFDALDMTSRTLNVKHQPSNPLTGDHPELTELIDYEAFCSGSDEGRQIVEISPRTLMEKMAKGSPFILDVREDYEYEISNIGGVLIPLNQLNDRLGEIPNNEEVVVMCKTGGRSKKAIDLLFKSGFKDLVNLKGGILAWRHEIDPTLKVY
ncbi:molybdopterin-synthase adenylyltransferase MoeB [Roseivirga misakiensis]|uniref:Molybdopterin-synthase adenylyltransferase n=1 Tax=Roseivirga misakiensis TaxID=1563681 RepID=A0A1E5SZZ9_9BACT|nr:molybdopterin-synthase adenylyltransferase MoeB [Roseivirga misakiensis]OEK04700.1 molybdenum cofactor biosynthesis protein MoeB [Roseivirga misakiensis]